MTIVVTIFNMWQAELEVLGEIWIFFADFHKISTIIRRKISFPCTKCLQLLISFSFSWYEDQADDDDCLPLLLYDVVHVTTRSQAELYLLLMHNWKVLCHFYVKSFVVMWSLQFPLNSHFRIRLLYGLKHCFTKQHQHWSPFKRIAWIWNNLQFSMHEWTRSMNKNGIFVHKNK